MEESGVMGLNFKQTAIDGHNNSQKISVLMKTTPGFVHKHTPVGLEVGIITTIPKSPKEMNPQYNSTTAS